MAGRSRILAAALLLSAAIAADGWAQGVPPPNPATPIAVPVLPPVPALHVPTTALRLFQANCLTDCWLSQLFMGTSRALREPVRVTNISTAPVRLTAGLAPANGTAFGQPRAVGLTRGSVDVAGTVIEVRPGEHVDLVVDAGPGGGVPAGAYAYTLELNTMPLDGLTAPVRQTVPVELRVRVSAVWPLFVVLVGILAGRLSQLVYDPQMLARLELLNWLGSLSSRIDALKDDLTRGMLVREKERLLREIGRRSADVVALRADIRTLETRIGEAEVNLLGPSGALQRGAIDRPTGLVKVFNWLGDALRIIAGVSPLPVKTANFLLPFGVLLSLVLLAIVFVLQQYGSGGSGEIFGAGGLTDYAPLFLAGVASDALTGGLRGIRFPLPGRA